MNQLRRLTSDDWQTYRDVRLAALAEAPDAFGSTLEEARSLEEDDWRARLADRAQFVLEDAGSVLGTVGAQRTEGAENAAELISMWVSPLSRGSGLGGRLVRAVLDWAREEGHGHVDAWVSEGNDVAERLYARHGFARTGKLQPIRAEDPGRLEFALRCELATNGR